jgi:hypothetical protein
MYQPSSIAGQGVGNCWQSSFSLHHPAPSCAHTPGGPALLGRWSRHFPTKAIPMLSVWIRGMGLRAQVLPFGTTAQTLSSTNFPVIGYRLPLFHMMAWPSLTKSSGIIWKSASVHGILSAGQSRY